MVADSSAVAVERKRPAQCVVRANMIYGSVRRCAIAAAAARRGAAPDATQPRERVGRCSRRCSVFKAAAAYIKRVHDREERTAAPRFAMRCMMSAN